MYIPFILRHKGVESANMSNIKSGNCIKCEQMVYVSESQHIEDGRTYIHWSCKEENKEEILRQKLHNTIDVMTLSQLETLEKSLFN